MRGSTLAIAVGVVLLFGRDAQSQLIELHSDGQGFSVTNGSTTVQRRSDGSSRVTTVVGNTAYHRYSNGTVGQTVFGPDGRFETYANPTEGWSGSGYVPYSAPSATTYERSDIGMVQPVIYPPRVRRAPLLPMPPKLPIAPFWPADMQRRHYYGY